MAGIDRRADACPGPARVRGPDRQFVRPGAYPAATCELETREAYRTMTLPVPDIIQDDPAAEADLERDREPADVDQLRHIVCLLCHPDFATDPVAHYDVECICGKPLHPGETAGPDTAPACVVCTELADGHYRRKHAKR